MGKNEDGEFELILGNRQLLSVFFIVVILLGVFFTMGYIVGRNSGPVVSAEVAAARRGELKPLVVDSPVPKAEQPAPDTSAPTAAAPAPVETPKPPAPERAKPAPAASASPSGTFLQLAATTEREADAMVDVLRKNGFKASRQEVPEKAGLFRVLVGPVVDGELNKTRADLQGKGFPGNAAIRRTF